MAEAATKIEQPVESEAACLPAPRRFTVEEYHRMDEAGILHEDDHVELLEGELIQMAALGPPHVTCVNMLNRRFVIRLGDRAIVSVQNSVRLSQGSEPQPDLILLRPAEDEYIRALPGPTDVLLVVEVAASSLAYDQNRKLPVYAAAGILEVWIVDLAGKRVLVYRRPHEGEYEELRTVRSGEPLAPVAFPDVEISFDEIFALLP